MRAPVISGFLLSAAVLAFSVHAATPNAAAAAQGAQGGTIKGHVKLTGKLPGNPVIRMGRDPMCAQINRGKQVVQETVVANLKGDLANVFVKLVGSFPKTQGAMAPVVIDQKGCLYVPRVVGVQAGQTLQIRNSDQFLHNVHSSSAVKGNEFNIGQPLAGMSNQVKLQEDPSMVRIRCDVHSWMTAFVGVVNHPYFAVSNQLGTFEINNVPPGTYEIQAWHERYGPIKQSVRVRAGATSMVDFAYTGDEKAPS
jgi:plastocyanin